MTKPADEGRCGVSPQKGSGETAARPQGKAFPSHSQVGLAGIFASPRGNGGGTFVYISAYTSAITNCFIT